MHNNRACQIKINQKAGAAWERQGVKQAKKTQSGVVQQLTIETKSAVKVKVDIAGKAKGTNKVKLTEMKTSQTAPLTKNQKIGYPEIAKSGGVVKGKGKPGFPGGTKIPPTKVQIIRKK